MIEDPRQIDPAETRPRKGGLWSRLPFWLVSSFKWLLNHNVFIILGVLAAAFLVYSTLSGDGLVKNRDLRAERDRLLAEIERLQDENRLLAGRLERLTNDPGYVEDEARKKLGLVRPDETIYRLSEEPDLNQNSAEPDWGPEAGPSQ